MGRIVVGVDGSAGSVHALVWAAQEARFRGLPLEVVLAWHPSATAYGSVAWSALSTEFFEDLRAEAAQRLDRACAAAGAELDGLQVERRAIEGAPAKTLVDAAAGADLLVVGTRGHGGFAGLLLGSVSAQCAHHAPCPLVIVPADTPA